MINGETRLLAVLGDPIAHTRSPLMHNAVLEKCGINMVYVPLRVAREDLPEAIRGLRALNFAGANVTLPHKEAVIPLLDGISGESRLIGAVNTIVNRKGRLFGTTTDPSGILMALKKGGVRIKGRAITVLGTGGSSRTMVYTLLLNGCCDVAVAGRHPEKAVALCREAASRFRVPVPLLHLKTREFDERMKQTDLLVNCTSVGMWPHANHMPIEKKQLRKGLTIFDIVYNPLCTRLLKEAGSAGAKTVPGIDMLVCQGMESFRLWTGRRPSYSVFYRSALSR